MPRARHPPKQKKTTRPRPAPVVPLTAAEQAIKAQEEFEKATTHLLEAERMSQWGRAPNACVHSAYYAMHHAAVAALFAAGGVGKRKDVPKSHEHVIQHYGLLIASEPEPLGVTGKMLSRARTDRMVADYDLVQSATGKDARDTTADARTMLDAVQARWNFEDRHKAEPNDQVAKS